VTALIAVDWGTTSLRAARLDAQGQVEEERASPQGILAVPAGGFPAALDALCDGWQQDKTLTLMSGMVGSRQGWVEAPYCACPAGFDDVARQVAWLRRGQLAIVPGLSCEHDEVPDVMRGEEVQVFGALRLLGLQDATVVLPGTHSKWVTVRGSRIEGFTTFMTGEFYALLRRQSILSRTLPPDDGPLDASAFDQGVAHALTGRSLLGTAFSARTLSLFERVAAESLPSYLSGLVIGEELRAQPSLPDAVVVIGSPELAGRYQRALAQRGITTQVIGHEATWQGLWALSRTLG
jgi:2-dehydro-3-deoxygalactonokinase